MLPKRRSWDVQAGIGPRLIRTSELLDSSGLLRGGKHAELRLRLQQDGYLFVRGLLPQVEVNQAHAFLLGELHRRCPASCSADGRALGGGSDVGLLSRQDLAQSPPVQRVLEAPALASLAAALFEEHEVQTTDFKWLRAVPPGKFTGLHTDRVFLSGAAQRFLTAWLPLQAVAPAEGAMLVCRGSHRSRGFQRLRESYGASAVGSDGTASGWLTDDGAALPAILGGRHWIDWRTARFEAGDAIVLHPDLLHMTAANGGARFRISCDTRWRPGSRAGAASSVRWRSLPG